MFPSTQTIFEVLSKSIELGISELQGINNNPHESAIEYLIQNPDQCYWIHLLRYNENKSGILEMLFKVGVFNPKTAKVQTREGLFEDCHTPRVQKFYDTKYNTELSPETIWFNVWRFVMGNPHPDALRILRANEEKLMKEITGYSKFDQQHIFEVIATNTNPETCRYLLELFKSHLIRGEKFWKEIVQNETLFAMEFFRKNIIEFYYDLYDEKEQDLKFSLHEYTLSSSLSRAFFDFIDDLEFAPDPPNPPVGRARAASHMLQHFLTFFYDNIDHVALCYNNNAAHFILQRQNREADNYITINYDAFSQNGSREAVKHLIETPSNIVWDVFSENAHDDAIAYMSKNRERLNIRGLGRNRNPGAAQILLEMFEADKSKVPVEPNQWSFWTLLVDNPCHEAVEIVETYFEEAVACVGFNRLVQCLMFNKNPRVLAILEKTADITNIWKDICMLHMSDDDDSISEYFENPLFFEYYNEGEEYALK